MAQHDYVIDNSTGANVRADINNVLQAIATNNSGSSDPSTTVASQFFADTNAGIMKLRNTANSGYVNLFTLAGGIDVDAASNFNEDVTFTGASANIVFDKSDNALEFADNAKAKFGNSADLVIYHDGTRNFIDSQSTQLRIETDALRLRSDSGETYLEADVNGAVDLYYDNSKKFETYTNGCTVTGNLNADNVDLGDNAKARFGGSNDLEIFHSGSNSFIKHLGTGDFFISCDNEAQIVLRPKLNEAGLIAKPNGAVELYHDNIKRFETDSNGARVVAPEGERAELRIIGDEGDDNNDYFKLSSGDGSLRLQDASNGSSWEDNIVINAAGSVELYYDNSKKFETTNSGSSFLDNVKWTDNKGARFGGGEDLQIFHDGSDSFIKVPSGGVGNVTVDLANGSAGFFVRTTSSSMANQTLKNNSSGADSKDFFQCRSNDNTLKLHIEGDGDVKNANNSYGAISDIKLKENIVDANSQWNDIKAVKVRNFNFKNDSTKTKMLGVVAQELETISAGLISDSIDRNPDTGESLGTTTKSVKYSILYMKAIKCLQEAMAKIEVLETEVAALKAA